TMKHGWFYNAIEKMFDAWLKSYAWTLRQTIRFKAATMVVSALLLVGTVYMFQIVPKGFIPSVDTGQINGGVELAQGVGYETTVFRMQQLMDILQRDPNVAAFTADSGQRGGINVDLKPREERKGKTADMIIEELRPQLNRIPGLRVSLTNPPAIRIGGGPPACPSTRRPASRSATRWHGCRRWRARRCRRPSPPLRRARRRDSRSRCAASAGCCSSRSS